MSTRRREVPPPGPSDSEAYEMRSLRAQVQHLQQELTRLGQAVAAGNMRPMDEPEPEDRGSAVADAQWRCSKCKALLAFYDPRTDVLRIRYKDFVAFMRVGAGGFVQVLCRGCGEINTQEYATPEDIAADPAT